MTTEELLFALAPDAKAVKATREVLSEGAAAFSALKRSADGEWLSGRCRGSSTYTVAAHLGLDGFRSACDCGSMKYPCKHAIALAVWAQDHPGDFDAGAPSATWRGNVEASPAKTLPKTAAAPTSAGEALLQAVWDDPDDTAAALIYADWLSENGGPEEQDRADLIRAQVSLGHKDDPALKKREKALIAKHRVKWLAKVPVGYRQKVGFINGFVRRIEITAAQLVERAERLAEHYPISHVTLVGNFPKKSVAALAVMGVWKGVRVLEMPSAARKEPQAVELFFRNIHLRAVKDLNMDHLGLAARGATMLAAWPGLAAVRTLSLRNNEMTRRCVELLCGSEHLGPLRRLILRDNALDTAAAGDLAGCERLSALTELDLGGNQIGAAGVKALASSPHLAGLTDLCLADNPITDAGARAVLDGLPKLTELRLSKEGLKPETVTMLKERFGKGLHLK